MTDSEPERREDGTFAPGNTGNPSGRPPKETGLFEPSSEFFRNRPKQSEIRDEYFDKMIHKFARRPVLDRYEIRRYVNLSVRLDYADEELGSIEESSDREMTKYRQLSTEARRLKDTIEWKSADALEDTGGDT